MRSVVLALFSLVSSVCAQAPVTAAHVLVVPHEVSVYIAPEVRTQLELAWDSVHAQQPERGYCLATVRGVMREDSVYVVLRAYRAVPEADDPYFVAFDCGPNQSYLHVHTPTTCERNGRTGETMYQTCVLGGDDAYLCYPSNTDQTLANSEHLPFLLIQCARDAFIAYYPEGTPPDSATHAAP